MKKIGLGLAIPLGFIAFFSLVLVASVFIHPILVEQATGDMREQLGIDGFDVIEAQYEGFGVFRVQYQTYTDFVSVAISNNITVIYISPQGGAMFFVLDGYIHILPYSLYVHSLEGEVNG